MSNILTVKRFQHVNTNFKILKKILKSKKNSSNENSDLESLSQRDFTRKQKFGNLKVRFLGLDESGRSMSDQDY